MISSPDVDQILNALRAHDERFDSTINKMSLGQDISDTIAIVGITAESEELKSVTAVVQNLPNKTKAAGSGIGSGGGGNGDDVIVGPEPRQTEMAFSIAMLSRHHPLWLRVHVTHPSEFTPKTTEALARLADAGIPLGSQTVLLKGINDDVGTMKSLMHGLLKRRVRPYYIYQCDPITGSAHFRTPVSKGLEIFEGLRGYTTGYAVPTFVIDAPGGGCRWLQTPSSGATEMTSFCATMRERSSAIPTLADRRAEP